MINRFRKWLAQVLTHFEPIPAAGGIVPNTWRIDDGVDYSQPLPVPDWLEGEQRDKYIQASVREASSVYHSIFDKPYLYDTNPNLFPTADPLAEWDFQVRKDILARCHLAFERNPLANTAVTLTTMFSVGEGMTVNYYNPDVEKVVEEFRANKENAIQEYEKSFLNDLQVDGEIFVRFHVEKDDELKDGRTVIVPIRPWEIDYIKTERGFNKRVVSYHFRAQQSDGTPGNQEWVEEDIPAAEMLHVAINKHSTDTRGRSELFRVLPWLKASKDWLEGRARQNHWRGGLLWDVTLDGALPNQVASKRSQYKQPPPPGSLVIHNEKETWAPMTNSAGGADVANDGREIKLMAIMGMKLPEYMLADGANANLASAKAQQLPALRKFTDFQDIIVAQIWEPIYKRVIENAIEAGILVVDKDGMVDETDADGDPVYEEPEEDEVTTPEPAVAYEAGELKITIGKAKDDEEPVDAKANGHVPPQLAQPAAPPPKPAPKNAKKIKACEAFDVGAPELEEDDLGVIATALQTAVNADWVSNETASGRMGFDFAVEQKKIKREKQASMRDAYQGMGNLPMDPNAPGLEQDKQPAPDQMPPQLPTNGNIPPQFLKQSNGHVNGDAPEDVKGVVERMLTDNRDVVRAEVLESEMVKAGQRAEEQYHAARNDMTFAREATQGVADRVEVLAEQVGKLSAEVKEVAAPIVIPPQLPPIVLSDETVLRVARAAAQEVSQTLSVTESVVERDSAGKPRRSVETYRDGHTETFEFEYDLAGRLSGKRRVG